MPVAANPEGECVPPARWLVLADDLTGAADTAMAFARAGWSASVAWSDPAPDDAVLARDAESRRLGATAAAASHQALLRAPRAARTALFKKIDSTLRGQPAAELAASLHALRDRGQRVLALVAPAFPAQGRTVEDGCIRLHGRALEATPLWAHEHHYVSADLRRVLEGEGLRVRRVPLAAVRDAARLRRDLRDAAPEQVDALVCDAVTEADLAAIVQAARPLADRLLWVGTAGLAGALAEAFPPAPGARSAAAAVPVRGGILVAVGSLAEASRAGAVLLAEDAGLLPLDLDPATLCAGPENPGWRAATVTARDALADGRDVLASITATPAVRPVDGPLLAHRLAALLHPAAPHAGALIATGGETALALLDAFGITGIRLLEEIEPGVPLGLGRGRRDLPIITKAGAFGDAGTLPRCLAHLRRRRGDA